MPETSVFLLTSECQDVQGKNLLRYYGRSPDLGAVEIQIHASKPVFFIPRSGKFKASLIPALRQPCPLKSFKGQDLDALYFSTYRDFRAAPETLRKNAVQPLESDVRPEDRYLMERFINAQARVTGDYYSADGVSVFINPKLAAIEIEPVFRVVSLDIETNVHKQTLYSIAVHQTGLGEKAKRVFIHSDQPVNQNDTVCCRSEKELVQAFVNWIQRSDPDLMIGWNVVDFDLQFIQKRAKALGVPLLLGRGKREAWIRPRENRSSFAWIPGRAVLDGPQTLRASFYSFEDFKLETVSRELLGSGKLIASGTDKIREIDRLFREDKKAFAEYNLQDAVLVSKIFEKTDLIRLCARRSQISGMLMNQIGLSTAAFDHFYLPRLHRRGFAACNVEDVEYTEPAAGGHVLDPVTGIHDHVLVFDFKSLYPSVIRTFKIDPLSRLCAKTHPITTPSGFRLSKTEHLLPDFIRDLLVKRAEAVKCQDAHLSQAIKILMNSFYGVMGSQGCRFYHSDLANAITSTGRWLLLESKKYFESQGYEVVYGDTDSLFVKIRERGVVDPQDLGARLAESLNQYFRKKIHMEFDTESFLQIEFEKYYKKYLLPLARGKEGGAKKRYAGLSVVQGKETLEFVGMEFVRSDWTRLAKDFQFELYERVFQGKEVRVWIKEFLKDLRRGKLDGQLVYIKRLNKEEREYTKSTPPHVKAARLLPKPSRVISYVMTRRGPIPIQLPHRDIDYDHYVDKQIRPIADSVLGFLGESFEGLIEKPQLELF